MNNRYKVSLSTKTRYNSMLGKPCTCELVGSACESCGPRYVVNGSMPYLEQVEQLDAEAINNAKNCGQMKLI